MCYCNIEAWKFVSRVVDEDLSIQLVKCPFAMRSSKSVPFMHNFRKLSCAVSLRTFCGHYVSEEVVNKILDDHYSITAALKHMNCPIVFPFTKTRHRKKASEMLMATIRGGQGLYYDISQAKPGALW